MNIRQIIIDVVFWLTTKLLSYVREDFLKMANIVRGYCHVVVRQSCTNGIICRFCRRFPCTGARIYIRLPHLRTRCCVFTRISGYKFPHTGEFQIWTLLWVSPGCKMQSNSVLLDTGLQFSIPDATLVSILQPRVHLLLVFLAVLAFSTWSEKSWLSWNGWMQTVKYPWCWTNGEGGSIHYG